MLALLMDFADSADSLSKRILIVVENLNTLLGEQMSDEDAWKFRHILLHEPRVMLLATAVSRFETIDNADKAFFELFRVLELKPLDENESLAVWEVATGTRPGIGRVRPLQILTGGNPRLLTIISSFAAQMSLRQLMGDLMQLVDENTEYFRSHIESLPSTERKVYLSLAEHWDPITASEVAAASHLGVSKTSALLNRLTQRGAVVSEVRGNAKRYYVAERMYNIYYLMRRHGASSARVKALVNFMISFYEPEKLVSMFQHFAEEACTLAPEDRRDHFYAYEALLETSPGQGVCDKLREAALQYFGQMPDVPLAVRRFAEFGIAGDQQTAEVDTKLNELLHRGDELAEREEYQEAVRVLRDAAELARTDIRPWIALGRIFAYKLVNRDEAEKACRKAIQLDSNNASAWYTLGDILARDPESHDEAEHAYRRASDLDPNSNWPRLALGSLLREKPDRWAEAEEIHQKALQLDPNSAWVWYLFGTLLSKKPDRSQDAESALRKALELDATLASAWHQLADLLRKAPGRFAEAEKAYRRAGEPNPNLFGVWSDLGDLLSEQADRYADAEEAYRKGTEVGDNREWSWFLLGAFLENKMERYDEAESAYRKAIEVNSNFKWGWFELAKLLHQRTERYGEAENAYRKAAAIDDSYSSAWGHLGQLLHEKLGRDDEAEVAYKKAIQLDSQAAWTWGHLGMMLHNKAGRYEEAEAAYRRAIELEPQTVLGWVQLAILLQDKLGRTARRRGVPEGS